MTIAELRAYLDEYAQCFDETVKTRIDSERFLAWLELRTASTQSEAETMAEAAAAVAQMGPTMDVAAHLAYQPIRLDYSPDAYQTSSTPAAEGANA